MSLLKCHNQRRFVLRMTRGSEVFEWRSYVYSNMAWDSKLGLNREAWDQARDRNKEGWIIESITEEDVPSHLL